MIHKLKLFNIKSDNGKVIAKGLYMDRKFEKTDPLLELYRGKLYNNILKKFIGISCNKLGNDIFSQKKSYPRTLTNILSSFMFTNYSYYNFDNDSFFPTTAYGEDIIKNTFNDLARKKNKDILKNLNELFDTLNFKNLIDNTNSKLKKYKKNKYYLSCKYNYKIGKKIIKQERNDKQIEFYKFYIKINVNLTDKRLINILDNILLPKYQYENLKNKYTGEEDKLDFYVWCILYRYQLLGSNNNQLAVLPNIMDNLKKDFGLCFECFASVINSHFKNFNSLYYDIEKYFGSYGSFFNMIPIEGTFGFNPPYQLDIIDNGVNRLISFLFKAETTKKKLTFIITIPIWDKIGKEKMGVQTIEYSEFNAMKVIRKSPFLRKIKMISKNDFTYKDHNFHLYKNTTIQNTYVIIMSTEKLEKELPKLDIYDYKSY
jgi:hypothetical protein